MMFVCESHSAGEQDTSGQSEASDCDHCDGFLEGVDGDKNTTTMSVS